MKISLFLLAVKVSLFRVSKGYAPQRLQHFQDRSIPQSPDTRPEVLDAQCDEKSDDIFYFLI
jgi:hypothetical protein